MSDEGYVGELIVFDADVPQCACACHNTELANAHAEIDYEGHPHSGQDLKIWQRNPRWVDRRDEEHAATACTSCRPKHALAYATDPMKAWQEERRNAARLLPGPSLTPEKQKHGPQGQCTPDCRWCNGMDKPRDERGER